jgi:nucleoside-diphosphate-sugar epimerase
VSGAAIPGTPDLKGKRALVVGGLGFLGLNLVGPLLDAGAKVRVLSRSRNPLALAWLKEIRAGRTVEVVQGDIGDAERHPEWFDDLNLIFQLAGESGAAQSIRTAQADLQANVARHLTLLEAIRVLPPPLPRVVFASSRLVYGLTGSDPVSEEHPTLPISPYGVHKLTVEHYHRLYWMHHGVPFCVLRITNPYGPYQLPSRHHGILNRFARAALVGETIPLYGGGGQLRDYVHVADVARGLLLAATAERALAEIFNLGAGASVTMGYAASRVIELAGAGRSKEVPWPDGPSQGVEAGDFVCDVSRIAERLDWRAEIDLDRGLVSTLDAFRRLML